MEIHRLNLKNLPDCINLHKKNLISPTSLLGNKYLSQIYLNIFNNISDHICLGAFAKNKLIGLIIVSTNPLKSLRLLHPALSVTFLFSLFKPLVLGKINIGEFWQRLSFENKIKSLISNSGSAYILILVVSKDKQRQKIGSELILKVYTMLPKYRTLWVDTRSDNNTAQRFYIHHGFKKEITERHAILFKRVL